MAHAAEKDRTPRKMMSFDFGPKWIMAIREIVDRHFPDRGSPTELTRSVMQEFVGCFLGEKEMKDRGLLAVYRTQSPPELLSFAIQRYEASRKTTAEIERKTR